MARFSVIASETVIARYAAITVEAQDSLAAAAAVEALRLDGELGDPSSETPRAASFEVKLSEQPEGDIEPTEPQFCVTAAGRAILAQMGSSPIETSESSRPVYQ